MSIKLNKRPITETKSGLEQEMIIKQIQLRTNMHEIKINTTTQNDGEKRDEIALKMHKYSIQVTPKVSDDNKVLFNQLLKSSRTQFEQHLGRFYISGRVAFSLNKMEKKRKVEVWYRGFSFCLKIKYKSEICVYLNNLHNIYKRNNASMTIQCLNVIFKSIQKEYSLEENAGEKKDKTGIVSLNQRNAQKNKNIFNVVNYQSCFGSQIYFKLELMINFNHQETVYQLIKKFTNQRDQENAIVGRYVYMQYNFRSVLRIHQIDFNQNSLSQFYCLKKQQYISYQDYYRTQYNMVVQDVSAPLLVHLRQFQDPITQEKFIEKVHLIPEFCILLKNQRKTTQKSGRVQRDHQNEKAANKMLQQKLQALEIMKRINKETGIQFDSSDTSINAFQLEPPKLILQNKQQIILSQSTKNYFINDQISNGNIQFKEWIMIYPEDERNNCDQLINYVKAVGQKLGVLVMDPAIYEIQTKNLLSGIKLLEKDFKKNQLPQFVLSYIPQTHPQSKTFYLQIKEFLCSKVGIEHQHLSKSFSDQNEKISIAQSIILQILSKLGNQLWKTSIPQEMSQKRTMIIAVSVGQKLFQSQDLNGEQIIQNMVGVVTSINKEMNRMNSEIFYKDAQDSTLHLVLSKIVQNSLNQYVQNLFELPDNIIIYRQGMSNSLIPFSIDNEVEAVRNGFKLINEKYNPTFAYIVVCKTVNQRFYSEKDTQQSHPNKPVVEGEVSNLSSARSGSVVPLIDNCTGKFEFFLCSQDIINGVTVPTKYICLQNDTPYSQQMIWQFTYNQCFNYCNSLRPIKIPAQLMYANKLLSFRQNILQNEPAQELKQSLYYI